MSGFLQDFDQKPPSHITNSSHLFLNLHPVSHNGSLKNCKPPILFQFLVNSILTSHQKGRKRKADEEQTPETPAMNLFKRSKQAANKTVDDLPTPPDSTMETDDLIPAVGKDPEFGTSANIKTFYEGKRSGGGHYDWVETPPKQLNEKVARNNSRVAIKIFKIKDHEQPTISGKTPLKIHSVEIQSQILVAALKDIVKEQGMYLEVTEPAKFQEPFKPLFFCYDKIMALCQKSKSTGLMKQHLHLLAGVMEELFESFMSHLRHLNASKLISYKLAWTYFPKDEMIYCGTRDCERVARVVSTQYVTHPAPAMMVACEEIAFNGEKFDWKPLGLEIPYFGGNLPVNELPHYPLSFHEDAPGIKERLTTRAKKVLDYQELTYCDYTGVGLLKSQCGFQRHNVSRQFPPMF